MFDTRIKELEVINPKEKGCKTKPDVLVAQWYPTLCDPMGYNLPLSMEFSRQKYWNGSNPGLLNCKQILYPLSHQIKPR